MAKGGQYERDICHQLSLWWTNGEDDFVFWRTANSGGRATVRAKKGKKSDGHCGDVCAVNPIGQPFIDLVTPEIKRGYNNDTFHALLDAPPTAASSKYETWIIKARDAAKRQGSYSWCLIHRRDRRRPLILFPESIGVYFEQHDCGIGRFWLPFDDSYVCVFDFEKWLGCIRPDLICTLSKELKHG